MKLKNHSRINKLTSTSVLAVIASFLAISQSASAMKPEDVETQIITRQPTGGAKKDLRFPDTAGECIVDKLTIPADITWHMFYFLDLKSYDQVNAVCKNWYTLAHDEKSPFNDLHFFLKTYRTWVNIFNQEPTLKNGCLFLKELRKAQGVFVENRRSSTELQDYADLLPAKLQNNSIFSEFIVASYVFKSPNQLPKDIQPHAKNIKNPTKIENIWPLLALLRAYDCVKSKETIDEYITGTTVFNYINQYNKTLLIVPLLKCLAPKDQLIESFHKEPVFEQKIWFATELAERGQIQTVFIEANTQFIAKEYDNAARLYSLVVEKEPDSDGEIYYNLGYSHFKIGNLKRAIEFLDISLIKGKDPVLAHTALAAAYFCKKNWNQAEEHYLFTVKNTQDPQVSLLGYLANVYVALEEWNDAQKYYLACLRIEPNSWDYNLNLGYLRAKRLNQPDQAGVNFKKCIDFVPDEEVKSFFPDTLGIMHEVLKKEGENHFAKVQQATLSASYDDSAVGLMEGLLIPLKENKKYLDWISRQQERMSTENSLDEK